MQFALSRKQTPKSPTDPSGTLAKPATATTLLPLAGPASGVTQAPHMVPAASTAQGIQTGKASASASDPSANAAEAATAPVTHTGKASATSASASAATSLAAHAAENAASIASGVVPNLGGPVTMDVTAADQQRIHEENQRLLHSMSPAEVRRCSASEPNPSFCPSRPPLAPPTPCFPHPPMQSAQPLLPWQDLEKLNAVCFQETETEVFPTRLLLLVPDPTHHRPPPPLPDPTHALPLVSACYNQTLLHAQSFSGFLELKCRSAWVLGVVCTQLPVAC